MSYYSVNNIKVSFQVSSENIQSVLKSVCENSKYVTKKDLNFFVLRKNFVYVAFFTGHINCTKLKSLEDLEQCQKEFKTFFEQSEIPNLHFKSPIIDNISASGGAALPRINLQSFARHLVQTEHTFRYNPETFPGLTLRIQPVTFTIFTSGKFIAVGAKRYVDLSISINLFLKNLRLFENQNVTTTN